MSEQHEISQLVTTVVRAWQEAGIRCPLPRNDMGVALSTASDIHVQVDPGLPSMVM